MSRWFGSRSEQRPTLDACQPQERHQMPASCRSAFIARLGSVFTCQSSLGTVRSQLRPTSSRTAHVAVPRSPREGCNAGCLHRQGCDTGGRDLRKPIPNVSSRCRRIPGVRSTRCWLGVPRGVRIRDSFDRTLRCSESVAAGPSQRVRRSGFVTAGPSQRLHSGRIIRIALVSCAVW